MDPDGKGQDSLPNKGQTSTQEPAASAKKWTDEEAAFLGQWHAETAIRQRHGKLDKQIYDLTGERDSLKKALDELNLRHSALQSERDKLVENKPGGVEFLKMEAKLRDLDKREADVASSMKVINEYNRSKRIADLAAFYVPDPKEREKFADKLTKLNPKTPEDAEEMAKVLATELRTTNTPAPDSLSGNSQIPKFRSNTERIEEAKKNIK